MKDPSQLRVVDTAVLLAAGRGKRLRPHTDITPKPLLPVQGRPTLDGYCESLVQAGGSAVVFVAHHLAEQIEAYAAEANERYGLNCQSVLQPVLDGTASALESVPPAEIKSPFFLLMACDYIISPSFIPNLLSFHASHSAEISISIKQVPAEELALRSSVRFDSAERITEIVEKPPLGLAPSEYSANLAYILYKLQSVENAKCKLQLMRI